MVLMLDIKQEELVNQKCALACAICMELQCQDIKFDSTMINGIN